MLHTRISLDIYLRFYLNTEASLSIASHPQKFHETGIESDKDFSILNIVNNLQYRHSLQIFVLINHQRWVPPLFKGKLQKGHLAFVSASDF